MCWSWGVFLWSTRGHARDEDPRPSHSPIPRLARFSLVARRRCQVLDPKVWNYPPGYVTTPSLDPKVWNCCLVI